jgi:hypothetical protein
MRTPALLLLAFAACDGPSDKPVDDTGANEAPAAPVIELSSGSATTEDDLRVVVISNAGDPDGDAVTYSYLWFKDGALVDDQVGDTVPADVTAKGEAWRVVVVASDGALDGPPAEAEVTILNTAPIATVVVAPEAPLTVDDLVVIASAGDADGDTVAFTYLGSVDGVGAGYTGETIPADATTRGETWTVTVTPDDGEEQGEPVSFDVIVGNSLPAITSVLLDPAEVRAGTEVACVPSGWVDDDGDAEGYIYAWYRNGADVAATPTLSGFVSGDTLSCTVTPTDGADEGAPVSSETTTVLNTAPSIDAATLSTTSPGEADTLSVSVSGAHDTDGDEISYTYDWYVDGVWVSDAETLDGTWFAEGDAVYVEVTPHDHAEAGAPVTSDVATAVNTPPVVTVVSLSPSAVYTADTLSASILGNDADGDDISYTYAWYVDGTWVSGAATLDGASFDKGDTVYLEVTPHDGTEAGAAVLSDVVTVGNTAPVVSAVSLSPGAVYTDSTLTASVTAGDADGDSLSYRYAWTVNGAAIAATGSTLSGATWFERDDEVSVTVTPNDGASDGTSGTSSSVTVLNTPPGAPSVSIAPSAPGDEDDLVCSVSTAATDADGDSATYTFEWTADGVAYTGSTSSTDTRVTVPDSATSAGEVWVCTVTADDGRDAGESAWDSVTVTGGGPWVYVADYGTNGVWRVDVGADTMELLFTDSRLGTPRGIALDDDGYLYVAQQQASSGTVRGVVRFGTDGTYVDQFLAGPYGSYGPGNLRYSDGEILVTGDTAGSGSTYRYDVDTGALISSFRYSGTTTVLGLHVEGDEVWVAGYFSGTIVRYDISSTTATSSLVSTALATRSRAITRGHNGNFFVADADSAYLYEYDEGSGANVGTFATFSGGQGDLWYDDVSNTYFVTSSNTVWQLDTSGSVVNSWTHAAMGTVTGIAVTYTEW